MQTIYDVLFIGNYTKDTIISPTEIKYVDGGAVNYASHAAAKLGYNVAVITRLASEDSRVIDKFKEAGIDCYATYTPQSTLMQLDYPTTNPDIRTLTVKGTAGTISVNEVQDFDSKAAVIGTSLRGEVGLDVIQFLKRKGVIVAADVQGFVRVLRGEELNNEPWEEMAETLQYIDILKSDAMEALSLTGESDIFKAARIYAEMGPKEIVLTHKDGLLIYADGEFYEMGFFPSSMKGRSGRGDTCLGSYTAVRLDKTPRDAGIWAAAVTSMKMEGLGPFDRSIADVESFILKNYNHGSVH
jgi:sugar/nucleoside kinase (ribokinase family)